MKIENIRYILVILIIIFFVFYLLFNRIKDNEVIKNNIFFNFIISRIENIRNILILLFIIFILFYIWFYQLIPVKYYRTTQIINQLAFIILSIAGIYGYLYESNKRRLEQNQKYIDLLIVDFNEIDKFLIDNYDDLKYIFQLMYNKVQFPTSDTMNIKFLFDKEPNKQKDLTFVLFNKVSYLLEKTYLIDKTLFDLDKLGVKIKLYIENSAFYEYWRNNRFIYNNDFRRFLEERYNFLSINNNYFEKYDTYTYSIPYTTDKTFIF